MKTIRFNLSKKSIEQAIQETRKQEAKVRQLCDVFAKKLAQEGVLAAREALSAYGAVQTEALLTGINYGPVAPGVWKVSAIAAPSACKANYAWYVEYGTGPAGAKNPHPEGGNYKPEGWITAADGKRMDAIYGWKPKKAEDGTTVYYTAGQPAKPFMYDSRKHIQDKAVIDRIMAEAIKEVRLDD